MSDRYLPSIKSVEALLLHGWELSYPEGYDGYCLLLRKRNQRRQLDAAILLPPEMVENEDLMDWIDEFNEIAKSDPDFEITTGAITRYHYEVSDDG